MLPDLRYALRALRRQPGFAAVAVVTLALGIGVASAIFSVANGVLLSPLPYPDAARLVVVQATAPSQPNAGHAPADYLDLRRQATSFEALAAYRPDVLDVSAAGTEPVRLEGAEVTADFFDTLGVRAETGRAFSARTDRPEGERLIVLEPRGVAAALRRRPVDRGPARARGRTTVHRARCHAGRASPGRRRTRRPGRWRPVPCRRRPWTCRVTCSPTATSTTSRSWAG